MFLHGNENLGCCEAVGFDGSQFGLIVCPKQNFQFGLLQYPRDQQPSRADIFIFWSFFYVDHVKTFVVRRISFR